MITLGFSTHRLEVLVEAEKLMMEHNIVALEEPPHPLFTAMLEGIISIDDYLAETEYEFPEFARASCNIYRHLHSCGKTVVQIDPYMEELMRIHELFLSGGSAKDIPKESYAQKVYLAEKNATESLIRFYKLSIIGDFEDLVNAVKEFARCDSRRILLRDYMRAKALSEIVNPESSLYVEAGYIHWGLQHYLRQMLTHKERIRIRFLLEKETKRLAGRKQIFGPGDTLTLLFMFHPEMEAPYLDLLAARSLIFVKLLHKTELAPGMDLHPHLSNEYNVCLLTEHLSWNDCRILWNTIRSKDHEERLRIVKNYLKVNIPKPSDSR